MKITAESPEQYWHQIIIHTTTDGHGGQTGAPWPLRVHVAAMVGNEDIAASITNFEPSQPSTWAVVLITAGGRLIGVRMQFDAENYDGDADRNAREPIDGIVGESWVRRLSDVVRLDIGKARLRLNAFSQPAQDLLDVADVSLTFGGGAVVDLGFDQLNMTAYDSRDGSDHFLKVLREHTRL